MKSLIKYFGNINYAIKLRNTLNIKPRLFNKNIPKTSSISDSFAWRTDNSYKTTFSFSDIYNVYFDVKNTEVQFNFYTKKNKFIKSIKLGNLSLTNKIIIDKNFLDGIEDFGTFNVYHLSNDSKLRNEIIQNRCYVGFSFKENLYSFVHGNSFVSYYINEQKKYGDDIVKTSFIKNQKYKIQKYFDKYDKNELFIINPTTEKIKFSINNENYSLDGKHSNIYEINKSENTATIISNCAFLRPIIFSYRENFLDVHHS